uniref:Immunoglobulin V-set domain-containing protein n=1 Tax=Stegastes partitus TaxID=144197 RepID=A0A3B4Z5L3_9TELE
MRTHQNHQAAALLLLFLSLMVVVGAAGWSEYKTVTAKVGEDITLDIEDTQLQREDDLSWSYGPKHTVFITYANGTLQRIFPDRFQLDERTGALTIRSLTVEDTRLYQCQIISERGVGQRLPNATHRHASKVRRTLAATPRSSSSHLRGCFLLCGISHVVCTEMYELSSCSLSWIEIKAEIKGLCLSLTVPDKHSSNGQNVHVDKTNHT